MIGKIKIDESILGFSVNASYFSKQFIKNVCAFDPADDPSICSIDVYALFFVFPFLFVACSFIGCGFVFKKKIVHTHLFILLIHRTEGD